MATESIHGTDTTHPDARDEAYDAVVIGGGMGGVTTGALLAHAGKKVLVVDENDCPGGYARAIRSGPYTFDSAVHLITGCAADGPFGPGIIDALLHHLGVRERCEFPRLDAPFYETRFPDFRLSVPHGRESFLDAHLTYFPDQADGLRNLLDIGSQIYRESREFPIAPNTFDLLRTPWRFPALFRYRKATVKQILDREMTDERLKAVYYTLWPWIGLPPSQASFLTWAAMMAGYVEDGAYYCRGSYQTLADAVAAGLTAAGGELVPGTRTTRILTADQRVQGVELDSGQRIKAPIVISSADARATFEELLEPGQLPSRFLNKLRQLTPSISVLSLYLATDLDVSAHGAHHETAIHTDWDLERVYADALSGQVSAIAMVIPSLTDPSLAPPGEHVVILQAVAPDALAGDSGTSNERIAEKMLELAEEILPGLREHLTFVEGAIAGTDDLFPIARLGPIYGWAMSPEQSAANRPPHETPVAGLYLAGHWTQPSHGITGAMESAVQVVRLILGIEPRSSLLPLRLPTSRMAA